MRSGSPEAEDLLRGRFASLYTAATALGMAAIEEDGRREEQDNG